MIRPLETLGNLFPRSYSKDGWLWKLNQKGLFTSKSYYLELSNGPSVRISHKSIWISDIPSKVSFFT